MPAISPDMFNEEYFERGVESGQSCYQNYRWIPELTIPMAMTIIDLLGIKKDQTVLDFGCAKGYLVKAFRLLHRQAWGVDVSEYAIANADPVIKKFCVLSTGNWSPGLVSIDFCIAKDVFEHIEPHRLVGCLQSLRANVLFAAIPLGENGTFRAPTNNMDVTHVTCASENWWQQFFNKNGWHVADFCFRVDGIKDSYYDLYPKAHGFFTLQKESGT